MHKKTPSPTHQVAELWKEFQGFEEPRHKAKLEMIERGERPQAMGQKMHSFATYRTEMQGAVNFVRWCKATYGMKYLHQIDPRWTAEYIEMRKCTVAPNTVSADMTAIRRLDKCLQAKVPERGSIVPAGLNASRKDNPRGAYKASEVRAIIAYVEKRNPLAADVLQVQRSGGLRLREAITLRPDKIDFRNGVIETLGKGGKIRLVELLDKHVLDRLDLSDKFPLRPAARADGQRMKEKSWMRDVQALVREACMSKGFTPRGTHGIRATAATMYYKSLVIKGMPKPKALAATAKWLGHGENRMDVLRKYLGNDLVEDGLKG